MALTAFAVSMAWACQSPLRPAMPLMAVTEMAMPAALQRSAFFTVSAAVTPLLNFKSSSSLPLSKPM